jgi:hypothetical protein
VKTLLTALLFAFVDHRPAMPPPLPEWSVVEVLIPHHPVPPSGDKCVWVTFVVRDGTLHGGGGTMPLRWLNTMPWRKSER